MQIIASLNSCTAAPIMPVCCREPCGNLPGTPALSNSDWHRWGAERRLPRISDFYLLSFTSVQGMREVFFDWPDELAIVAVPETVGHVLQSLVLRLPHLVKDAELCLPPTFYFKFLVPPNREPTASIFSWALRGGAVGGAGCGFVGWDAAGHGWWLVGITT